MFHSCRRLKHFSIHQHPSAPLPRHPWLCVALEKKQRITHSALRSSTEMANGAAGEQCDGYYPHLSLMRVQPQTLGSTGPSVSPLAIYPLSDHAAGGGGYTHFSTSKQIPHAFNSNIHAFLVEMASQRGAPAEYATTADSVSYKK